MGKTTLASASAVKAADSGRRTLLVSTDNAHSLADILDLPLAADPVPVTRRMYAVQLDARQELQRSWDRIAAYLKRVVGLPEIDNLRVEELLVVPGLDQLLALARLHVLASDPQWDAIIVDCAPSADSLRLLMIPEVLGWYVEKLFGRRGVVGRMGRKQIERVMEVPLPDQGVISSVEDIANGLTRLRSVLSESTTTARVVVTPERLTVAEGQRTVACLALYGYSVDAVLLNKVDADNLSVDRTSGAAPASGGLAAVEEGLAFLPRLTVRQRAAEPIGVDALRDVSRELYGPCQPMTRLTRSQRFEITRLGQEVVMRIPLPGARRDDVILQLDASHLIITLGDHRRTVMLPDALRGRAVLRAGIINEHLEVVFTDTGCRD